MELLEKIKRAFKKPRLFRFAGLCFLLLFTLVALVYQQGYFSISFIREGKESRQQTTPADTTGEPGKNPTTTYEVGDEEDEIDLEYVNKYLYELRQATNISKIGLTASEKKLVSEIVDERPVFQSAALLEEGYRLSYKDYLSGAFVIAEIDIADVSKEYTQGVKDVVAYRIIYPEQDAKPYAESYLKSQARLTLEPYMGYIIHTVGGKQLIKSSTGALIGTFEGGSFMPAYTRDSQDRPLFYLGGDFGRYFYLEETTGQFVPSDYIDQKDTRGLYFDYNPDFGKSDNTITRLFITEKRLIPDPNYDPNQVETEPETTSGDGEAQQDTSILSMIVDGIGYVVNRVVSAVGSLFTFKSENTAAPQTADPAEETTTPAETTGEADTTAPGDTTAPPDTTAPDTTAPADTTDAPVTTEPPSDTTGPADTTAPPDTTEPADTTAPPDTTEPADTTAPPDTTTPVKDPPMIEIEIYKGAFGYRPGRETTSYKYSYLYNFSGGYGVGVEEDGNLVFVLPSGWVGITGKRYYFNANGAYVLASFAEPLLRGAESLGYYYFDEGLVRVRQLDRDSKGRITGDYDYLIDAKGNRFNSPAGYRLISYSDGILLLEKNGYYGYYHKNGYWIAQPIYTYARPFVEGLGVIGFKGSKKGVIDTAGNVVVPFAYEAISDISSGIMIGYRAQDGWTVLGKFSK